MIDKKSDSCIYKLPLNWGGGKCTQMVRKILKVLVLVWLYSSNLPVKYSKILFFSHGKKIEYPYIKKRVNDLSVDFSLQFIRPRFPSSWQSKILHADSIPIIHNSKAQHSFNARMLSLFCVQNFRLTALWTVPFPPFPGRWNKMKNEIANAMAHQNFLMK